jgi:phosphoribosylformylglycinamidine synthase subunit PurQ / glutaminase
VRSGPAAGRADPQPLAAISLRTYFSQDRHDQSPFTNKIPAGKILRLPIAHGEGCYFADEATLDQLKANRILWQYADAKGELTDRPIRTVRSANIAGICNEARNVAGLMPHPERASEAMLGGGWTVDF